MDSQLKKLQKNKWHPGLSIGSEEFEKIMNKYEDRLWCAEQRERCISDALEVAMDKLPGDFEWKKYLVAEIEDAQKNIKRYKQFIYENYEA